MHADTVGGPQPQPVQRLLKRAFDVVFAATLVITTVPVVAIAALFIYFDDRGPVLYAQRRVGFEQREFTVFKLRSMRLNTLAVEEVGEVRKGHPLVTPVGHIIRRFKIDELPQLLNVLRGEMSVVGPRPTVMEQVVAYTPFQRRRLDTRPGLTGWAQVNGGTQLGWPERIMLDVWYVDNWSLLLDARILARTFLVVLLGERAGDDRALRQAVRHAGSPPSTA